MTDSQKTGETVELKSSNFTIFLKKFESQQSGEEKLKVSIDFMRDALSQERDPNFKGFWEARKNALPVFKENLHPVARLKLWNDFIELSSEARRLKSILDEQANFAIEQLELAIDSLEKEIAKYDENLAHFSDIEFPERCKFLKHKQKDYNTLQKELNLLNTFAAKINALRKEVLKTDMRVRFKSKFFKTLSVCGDKIFPKRNDIIKSVSHKFMEDIGEFINMHFSSNQTLPSYILKDEIKNLQNIAKMLTLNTKAFTETRLKLSECWDKLKAKEEENKKEFLEKKKATKENYESVFLKIKDFSENSKQSSLKEAEVISNEILDYMKSLELHPSDVKRLKNELKEALNVFIEKDKEEKNHKEKKILEELEAKKQKVENVKAKIKKLFDEEKKHSVDHLTKEKESILAEIESLNLTKMEKQLLEKSLKPLKDVINDKKEKAILDLSEDQKEALGQLKELLEERVLRRNEIRDQLEQYRKSGFGLDFEKAILQGELIEQEKERLEKINSSIEELEEKIAELEG